MSALPPASTIPDPDGHLNGLEDEVGETEVALNGVLILYATETGNALDIAEQLARETRRRKHDVRLASVDAYPLVRPSYSLKTV